MVWLVLAIPASAVVVGAILLILAITSNDGLVADDYYARGRAINRVLNRDHFAERHAMRGDLHFYSDRISLRFESSNGLRDGESLALYFVHPTRSGEDRVLKMERVTQSTFSVLRPELAPGHWRVQVETLRWRLLGYMHSPSFNAISLLPASLAPERRRD